MRIFRLYYRHPPDKICYQTLGLCLITAKGVREAPRSVPPAVRLPTSAQEFQLELPSTTEEFTVPCRNPQFQCRICNPVELPQSTWYDVNPTWYDVIPTWCLLLQENLVTNLRNLFNILHFMHRLHVTSHVLTAYFSWHFLRGYRQIQYYVTGDYTR